MKKTILSLALALMLAPALNAINIADEPADEQTEQSESKEKKDKKDKKDKDKKKKKKKDKKAPRKVEEVLADLQALEWDKPAKSGLEIDQWYDEADEFFKLVRGIEDNVPLYSLKAISVGDSILVLPVDKTGTVRHRKESFEQVALGVLYGTNLALQATNLALGTVNNSVQIGLDAVPLVGDAKRKKANVQIAKATKAIPLLKEIVTTQNNMMKKYMEMNYNVTGDDAAVEAMKELNVDFDDMETWTEEDYQAYLAGENEAAGTTTE